jgi:hypothetical protein
VTRDWCKSKLAQVALEGWAGGVSWISSRAVLRSLRDQDSISQQAPVRHTLADSDDSGDGEEEEPSDNDSMNGMYHFLIFYLWWKNYVVM